VERVVTANRVLPVALRDGYSLTIVAVQERLLRSRKAQDASIAAGAAERCFVDMLMSEWRLKIAKCPGATCGMYFRLGKWNHVYDQGTHCPDRRQTQEPDAIQKRVEAGRLQAKQALYEFVAARFARHKLRPLIFRTRVSASRPVQRDGSGRRLRRRETL
jgi:hypothetical protein